MLGGGNLVQIPEMNAYFNNLLAEMLEAQSSGMCCVITMVLRAKMNCSSSADMLRNELGWEIGPAEYCTDNGQAYFSASLNLRLLDDARMVLLAKCCSR